MSHRVGIVGSGSVLPSYLRMMSASAITVVGLADAARESTQRAALEHGLPTVSIDELLESDADCVLCLAPPHAHHELGQRALAAGKHFYAEKPMAQRFEQASALADEARLRKLRLGSAPDTFLGGAAQTARRWIDEGVVGAILYGSAHCMSRGPDHWHPQPQRFYTEGSGPLLDMGVYYVTHLVHHLGAVARVNAHAHMAFRERLVTAGPSAGRRLRVEVPTHVVSSLTFEAGPIVELTTSFEVWRHALTPIELYGEEGSILLADPNHYDGPVRFCRFDGAWQPDAPAGETLPTRGPALRGLGVVDMLHAIDRDEDHRCNDELATHVLEVLEATLESARLGRGVSLQTRCIRPRPLGAQDNLLFTLEGELK